MHGWCQAFFVQLRCFQHTIVKRWRPANRVGNERFSRGRMPADIMRYVSARRSRRNDRLWYQELNRIGESSLTSSQALSTIHCVQSVFIVSLNSLEGSLAKPICLYLWSRKLARHIWVIDRILEFLLEPIKTATLPTEQVAGLI